MTRNLNKFTAGDTLRALLKRVRRILRARASGIASVSAAERILTWRAIEGEAHPAAADFSALIDEDKLTQLIASDDALVVAAPPRSETPRDVLFRRSAERVAASDFFVLPLRARGELIGALAVGYGGAAPQLDGEAKVLLEGLAELAALALDNVLLFETVSAAKRVWEQTFDAIPDGIIVHDHRLLITRCNLRAAEMLGLQSPAEAIGLSRHDTFVKIFGERAAAYHVKPSSSGGASSFEMQAESGRRYLISVAPFAALDGGREWSVLTWSDVTDLSEMQDQLARARRLAMVGQLAAGVAHEINNPLAAITTCAETMLLDIKEDAAAAALAVEHEWPFYLEEVVRQALRGKAITRGLLDLARPRRAEQRPADLPKIIAQCVKLFAARAPANVAVEARIETGLGWFLTDDAMLRQVLDNLMSNALDALGARGGRLTITASVAERRLLIEVADTGPGIPPDLLTRVFEPFYTTKEVGKGSGLGLSISATLAENLGGTLTAHSEEGVGSRFLLWLPHRPLAEDFQLEAE